jgi:hypothetical protein
MSTSESKPWERELPENVRYQASSVRVLISLIPLVAIVFCGCAIQYGMNGALSPGMEWVLAGIAAFVLSATIIIPSVNYLEFTPQHFTVRELFRRKRMAWDEIEPGSIGYIVREFLGIPMLTSIGFRLKPDSPNLTTVHQLAGVTSGFHVYFVSLYTMGRDEIIGTLQQYQAKYGTLSSNQPGPAEK